MLRDVWLGTTAGAAGTVALNVSTYLDMAVRGRPSSETPAQVAEKIAAGVGVHGLSSPPENGQSRKEYEQAQQQAQSRRTGAGALMGYLVGLGVGAAYGALRPIVGHLPVPLAGALLGLAAMAGSDVPAAGVGATDPSEWGTSGWLADIIPHLAYGLVTAAVYQALISGKRRQRDWTLAALGRR